VKAKRACKTVTVTERKLARGWRYKNGTVRNGVVVFLATTHCILFALVFFFGNDDFSTLGRLGSLFSARS